MKTILKYKKIVLSSLIIILISSLGIFVLGTKQARADYFGIVDGLKTVLGEILLTIQQLVGTIVSWLAILAQGIISFTHPQNAQIVQDGWEISRDLTNMFFVLVLLTIALATILRLETYGMKALLPKLIGVALLINFSLVFAGVIIDFSGVLTDFFIEDGQEFFTNFAASMRLTKTLTTTADEKKKQWQCHLELDDAERYSGRFATQSECNDNCPPSTGPFSAWTGTCEEMPTAAKVTNWKKLGGDYWPVISSLFFSIIFTIIAAFVFGAFAFLLLIRVLAIWFLLILAPLAWFFWILPATRHLFTQWWNNFIKWVFFAPAAIFFIWLSVNSWLKFIRGENPSLGGEIAQEMNQTITDEVLSSRLIPQIMLPENFVQFILVCGMLIGSLIVAQQMGIYGAKGAVGLARGAGKGIAKWSGGLGMRTALKMAPPPKKTPEGKPKGGWIQRGLSQVAKVPLVGKLAKPAYQGLEQIRDRVNKRKEAVKGWTSDNIATNFDRANAEDKVAMMLQLHENGDLDKLNKDQHKKGIDLAKRYNMEGKLLKSLPSFADDIQDTVDKMNAEAASKIVTGELKDERVTGAITKALQTGKWSSNHLTKIANENANLRLEIEKEIITDENIKTFAPAIQEYLKSYLGSSLYKAPSGGAKIITPGGGGGGAKFTDAEREEMLKT